MPSAFILIQVVDHLLAQGAFGGGHGHVRLRAVVPRAAFYLRSDRAVIPFNMTRSVRPASLTRPRSRPKMRPSYR
jgi:hypothetical protein